MKRSLAVRQKAVSDLRPYEKNARTHSEEQIDQICRSIEEFGWTNPILIDEQGGVIAGHARLEAASRLGFEKVPTITLSGLTEAQRRAYILADNKLALNAGWDEELLRAEFEALHDMEFDLSLTGFDGSELDGLLAEEDDGVGPGGAEEDECAVPATSLRSS